VMTRKQITNSKQKNAQTVQRHEEFNSNPLRSSQQPPIRLRFAHDVQKGHGIDTLKLWRREVSVKRRTRSSVNSNDARLFEI
jgi:hypothetical protein